MHAALLWATLIVGAPVLPHSAEGDPAAEGYPRATLTVADELVRLGEQLLACRNIQEYLQRLDLAVLAIDISP